MEETQVIFSNGESFPKDNGKELTRITPRDFLKIIENNWSRW